MPFLQQRSQNNKETSNLPACCRSTRRVELTSKAYEGSAIQDSPIHRLPDSSWTHRNSSSGDVVVAASILHNVHINPYHPQSMIIEITNTRVFWPCQFDTQNTCNVVGCLLSKIPLCFSQFDFQNSCNVVVERASCTDPLTIRTLCSSSKIHLHMFFDRLN